MKSDGKLLIGLGIGVAVGAVFGYILANDKKEEWLEQAVEFADRVKANVKDSIYRGKSEVSEIKEDIEDIADIAKKELATD